MLWWASLVVAMALIFAVRRHIQPHTVITAVAIGAVLIHVNLLLYRAGQLAQIGHATLQENGQCEIDLAASR
jgi:hypothetical protein